MSKLSESTSKPMPAGTPPLTQAKIESLCQN